MLKMGQILCVKRVPFCKSSHMGANSTLIACENKYKLYDEFNMPQETALIS